MNPKSATLPFVVVTWLAALHAGRSPATVSPPTAASQGTTVAGGPEVPALEPSFAVLDVPELRPALAPAPRLATAPALESDSVHVARLMAGRMRCGDTYANDVGGRNAECLAGR